MSNSEVNTGSNDGDPPKLTVNLPSAKDVDAATKHRNAAVLPVDVLLLTVKDCEFFACYRKFINPFRCWFDEIGFLYFEDADNGEKVRVALVQCSEGSVTPGGSLITVTKAVPVLRPKAVISVGTCSSLNPTKTKLGDVVVSAKLKELPTGMRNYVSRRFLKVINHTAYGYKAPLQDPEVREITVHRDGEFLSGPEKVCSESRRKELAQCHHQAIATEMEGGGVFTAAFEDQIEWLIVKGIADYADGDESTTERWSPFASVMAASVVEHILSNAEVFGAWPNYCSEGHSIPSVKFPRADSPSQSTASHSDLSGQQSTCDERKKWTGMNDGKPSGEQSHKKGRKEKTSGPTCDLDRLIRLIISAEGLDDEQKEALYEILTHNGQLYVKHRKISGDVLEQGIDFFEYLTETYKFNLVRVIRSSLEITMYCPTIESLEHLWSDYLSGHLNDIAERLLVTDEIKRLLSLQKNVRLRTTIEEENYLICKKFLMEMSGLAGHTLSSSEETIPNQVEDTRKGNSSFLMEYSPEQLNYFRICYVALNLVPVGLRQIFRNEWNFLYNRTPLGEWKDAPQNGQDFYNKESRKSRTKNARYLATIQNGDTSEWDCSCLFFAILYSDSIGTTLSPAIRTAVDAIRQVRDEIAHISEGKVTNAEFQTYVGRVSTAFTALHLSIKEIRDVKNQKSFPTKEVKMLKNEVLNLRGELDQAKTVLDETKTGLDHTKANLQATKSTPLKTQADLSSAKEENETLTQELSSKLESFCFLTLKAPHEVIRRSSDIERLSNKMQGLYNAAKGEVSTIFFSGNPGCGKSQLARELGSKFFSDNADALTFVATLNAESVETLAESYLSLGENLGLPEYTLTKLETLKQEKPGESIRHLQRSILRKVRQFSKWLIIADNVVDLNSVRHFLPQTGTEEWGHGQVLITTQDSSAVPLNAPHTYHESFSRGMQPADAVELLEKISQLSDSDQTEKVARILDYQPLALAAAAYYVQTVAKNGSPYYNWSMYLEGFTEIQREVTENVLASESLTYPTPTATAVKMAMERAVETDEVLCQAFLFFSVCSSDAVPLDAVVEFVKVRVTDQTEELIKTKLLKSSLVLLSAEEDKQCLHLALHNIVHAVLKQDAISKLKSWDKNQNIADAVKIFKSLLELSRENRALLNQLAIHCKSLIEHMTFNSTLSIKEFVMEAAHFVTVNQVVDWLCSFSEACAILCDFTLAKSIVDLGCSLIDNINDFGEGALLKGKIFNRSGEALHSIGKYNEAKNFHEKALMIRRKISGEDHPNVATSYSNLGLVYYEMGEYHRAKEFHEKALMIKRRKFGEDHPNLAISYRNLGLVYYKLGKYNRAKEFHEKALMIYRWIYDEDHPNVATSYSNLGLVFYEMGDYNRAREFHEKALMIYRKIYAEDHPNVATSYSNLGLVYYEMDDYNRAKEFHEKALMIYRNSYDEDHPNVATIYSNLGLVYYEMGDFNRAIEFHEKALMIYRKIYDEDHPNVAKSYSNLGLVYYEMGEYHRAKEFHEKALMIKRRIFGEDHRDVATSYSNLGLVYEKMGEYNRAKEFHEKALMINRKIYDEDHPNVATSYSSLGLVFYEMGDYNRAKKFHEKALMIYRKIYAEDHPNVATSNSNLGLVYYNMGDYNRAKEFHEKALMIKRRIFGEDHPNVAKSYSNLGLVFYEMGDYNRAKEFHEKALMIYRKIYDEDHPNVATSNSNLGLVYYNMGDYNRAKKFHKKTLMIYRKIYDEDHPNVATSYSNLGLVYCEMGEYNRAKEFHEKALMIYRKIYDEDHPNVVTSYSNLGLVYYEMGVYNRAKEFHEKALMIYRKIYDEDHPNVATIYSNLGLVYYEMGDYNRAKEFHEKVLMIYRKIYDEDDPNVTKSYSNLGLVYYEMGEYHRAKEFHEKALMIKRRTFGEDHRDVATSYSNLGLVYEKMGEYNRAKEFHEKALMINRKIYDEDHPNVATSCSSLGLVFYEMGDYNRAKEFHEKALMIYRKIYAEDHPNVATSNSNLGLVYYNMGDYNRAREFHEKALMINRKIYDEDHPNVATSYSNLGLVYYEMGDYNRAKEFHEKALMIYRNSYDEDNPNVATSYSNLGLVYHEMGNYNQAKEFYEKALFIDRKIYDEDHPNVATIYSNLGLVYHEMGEYNRGKEFHEKALKKDFW